MLASRRALDCPKDRIAISELNPPLLHVLVPFVQQMAQSIQFEEVCGEGILEKFVGCASGLGRELLQARLGFRRETNFHGLSLDWHPMSVKASPQRHRDTEVFFSVLCALCVSVVN